MDNEFKKIIAQILNVSADFQEIEKQHCPIWDSMKHAEIVIKLQNRYKIKFELSQVLEIHKVSEFYKAIEDKKGI